MRTLILSAITAIGIGVLGISGLSAAPANGIAIGQAASGDQLLQDVRWYGRGWGWGHRRGWGWRGGYRRGWCYWHPYRCGWR